MYKRRGQGALEFLMTYGWAILVVVVVLVSLNVYFSSDAQFVVPETCFLGPGFACNDFAVYEDSLTLAVVNGMGKSLEGISIQNSQCLGDPNSITLENGEESFLVLDGCNFNSGDLFSENLNLSYSFLGSSIMHLREVSITAFVQAALNSILFLETDLEEGTIPLFWDIQRNNSQSILVVNDPDPLRDGNNVLKFNVDYLDFAVNYDATANKSRAELALQDGSADLYPMNDVPIFYGWSIYFPEGYEYNVSAQDRFNIIGQWYHRAYPDTPEAWQEWLDAHGGRGMPPSVHVEYEERANGERGVGIAWKPTPETPASSIGEMGINLGEWNDLVFEIKWSTEDDGYIKAWLNGQLFTDKSGIINMYNPTPKKLKVGLYRGPSARMENTVYYDNIRIGGSYELVDPSNY
ncbi:hypothetical protein HOF78_01235 [Candidatus Woesearchaeota archaeon]|jgi:hypothetical protein|nr:hypothetical protein [Candidatus Woesearchaeota archaeon]MBT6044993.1 hypothetical protein [Candidatus Woesearchaeota archaeon]